MTECPNCGNIVRFLSEATERRTSALERHSSPSQLPTAIITLDGSASYRRIQEAFHCKLKGPVLVDKKTLVELQNFQTVSLADPRLHGYTLCFLVSTILFGLSCVWGNSGWVGVISLPLTGTQKARGADSRGFFGRTRTKGSLCPTEGGEDRNRCRGGMGRANSAPLLFPNPVRIQKNPRTSVNVWAELLYQDVTMLKALSS